MYFDRDSYQQSVRRAREERWRVRGRARVVHPKYGAVVVPHRSNYAALLNAAEYPDLFERAIALEHGSAETNVNVKGLGRNWSWESYYNEFMANKEFEEAQLTFDQLFPDSPGGCICGAPCGCYDG